MTIYVSKLINLVSVAMYVKNSDFNLVYVTLYVRDSVFKQVFVAICISWQCLSWDFVTVDVSDCFYFMTVHIYESIFKVIFWNSSKGALFHVCYFFFLHAVVLGNSIFRLFLLSLCVVLILIERLCHTESINIFLWSNKTSYCNIREKLLMTIRSKGHNQISWISHGTSWVSVELQ